MKNIIKLLCWSSLLLSSCKKELNNEFDPIIGKWRWVKTIHGWYNAGFHEEIVAESSSSEYYSIEFIKKGKIILYKNGKDCKKYRVKHYSNTFVPNENVWGYDISLSKKTVINVAYYVSKDTLVINSFFPKTKAEYPISDQDYIENHFVRE